MRVPNIFVALGMNSMPFCTHPVIGVNMVVVRAFETGPTLMPLDVRF